MDNPVQWRIGDGGGSPLFALNYSGLLLMNDFFVLSPGVARNAKIFLYGFLI
jgi:hypothetical protein